MNTHRFSPDPKPKDRKQNPTNQDRGALTAELTDSPDLNGERLVPSSQDPSKPEQGEYDNAANKSDIFGKQIDDYLGEGNDSDKEQFN